MVRGLEEDSPSPDRNLRRPEQAVCGAVEQLHSAAETPCADRTCPGSAPPARNPMAVLNVCAFLLVAVIVVFGPTIGHKFVNFDDGEYVYKNPQVARGLSVQGVVWAFSAAHAGNWHPLTWISHMLDCQFYDLKPYGHHLTNVVLHAATAILLFLVLLQMTGAFWTSALVAVVFAVHPLRVESVAWVSERKDVLSGLFFMLTLAAYAAYVRQPFSLARYLAVVVPFALGLMAKPTLVTLPFVLLLLDYWPLGRFSPPAQGQPETEAEHRPDRSRFPWRLVVEKLPLLALAAASCVVTVLAEGDAVQSLAKVPLPLRIANALVSYVTYLRQLFFPVGLAAFYPHPGNSLMTWKVAAAFLLLLGISIAVLAYRRKCPYLVVGWLWYLGTLVPVIGLVQVGLQERADRYTYLTQIGLYIAVAFGVAHLTQSWRSRQWLCGVAGGLIVVSLMGCARQQTSYWRNSEAVWRHTLSCTPDNPFAHNYLGTVLWQQGKFDEATAEYRRALELQPAYAEAHNNLGVALDRQGKYDKALAQYQKALQFDNQLGLAHYNVGVILARKEMLNEAIEQFRAALLIDPCDCDSRLQLGMVLCRQGMTKEGITEWRDGLRVRPDSVGLLTAAARLLATEPDPSLGSGEEAVAWAERATQLTGGRDAAVLDTLAAAYAATGRFAAAVEVARKAASLALAQNNSALADALRTRIELYQANEPLRESRPPTDER